MNWSIGGKTIDVYDDVGLTLLASSGKLDKVASLQMGDPKKLAALEDRQFGLVFITKNAGVIRKYPLNDRTNVVLSDVYFDMTHDRLPPEAKVAAATQIKEACELWGVPCSPATLKYATEGGAQGRNYVRLGLVAEKTAGAIELYEQLRDAYTENRDLYGREDKVKLARTMAQGGEKVASMIPEDLKPFAIKDPAIDKEAFLAQCGQRKSLLQGQGDALGLMNEFMAKHASFQPLETVKLLETFDRQFGLDRYWDRGLEPNMILQEKVAYHDLPIANCGGVESLSDDEIKAWVGSNGELLKKMFGKELAEKFEKNPRGTLWELPRASRDFLGARIEYARDNTPVEAK